MKKSRITVTLPPDLVREIDRAEKNRSRFIQEAVARELDRRRKARLRQSLASPHPETLERSEEGYEEWFEALPDESGLLVRDGGREPRWNAEEE